MDKRLFLFFLIFFMCDRMYFLGDTYHDAMVIHTTGQHIKILFLVAYIIHLIPYKDIKNKICMTYLFILSAAGSVFYTYVQSDANFEEKAANWLIHKAPGSYSVGKIVFLFESVFIPLLIIILVWQIYKKISKFDPDKSAELNNYDIFLLKRYPKNILGLFLCVFTPIKGNSLSLYADGYVYQYNKTFGRIHKIKRSPEYLENYFAINTNTKVCQKRLALKKLKDNHWSPRRNCLTEFQSVIGPVFRYMR